MEEIANHNCYHDTLGISKMRKSFGKPRLAERLEEEKTKKKIFVVTLLGLGLLSTTVLGTANLLLQREYPVILEFEQDKKKSFGTIMVPQIVIPGVPKIRS